MTRGRHVPRARENPLLQRVAVKAAFPQFRWCITRAGGVEWKGTLQPTPDSPVYEVRVVHEPDRIPRVYVERPAIRSDAWHRYPDGSLCLYWPDEWVWTAHESLVATIIPWAAFWLYYYELWVVTGEWLGPSSPHRPGTRKEAV
jgi:hypothetical protein